MQRSEFNFPFESSLIAEHPVRPRDHARLLVVPRGDGVFRDRHVFDLPRLCSRGDVVVVNDTRVIPAKFMGRKSPSGGKVELLLVRPDGPDRWEAMIKGKAPVGQRITLREGVDVVVQERTYARTVVRVESDRSWETFVREEGQMPLPPYIRRLPTEEDREDYQTMFAAAEGAVAAPTAGLHFTPDLYRALTDDGVSIVPITLHVGPGTFRPVTAERIEAHRMDAEWFRISATTAEAIMAAKRRGNHVVAVGTTVTRCLEAVAAKDGVVRAQEGATDLFITPGYPFRVVDRLMTNFHLPGTTLLMLVAAFAGFAQARQAYAHAIAERYRFYSYGDAMFIL